jgi:putative membrane protein
VDRHETRPEPGTLRLKICWAVTMLWVAAYLVSVSQHQTSIGPVAAGLQALLLMVFVALHGSLSNGWRGFASFLIISAAVGFGLEASSIASGFPFGFYVHHLPGPKPLGVPLPVLFGYCVLGWVAWSVARLIARQQPSAAGGLNTWSTPVIASFVLAGYDYAYDPIGGTVLGLWTYRYPSGVFGVPLSNFFGWLFTGWLFFQLFACLERRFPPTPVAKRRDLWLLPCIIWLMLSAQYPLLFAAAAAGTVTQGGRTFVIADVYEAAVAASLFTTVFTALVAMTRIVLLPTGHSARR